VRIIPPQKTNALVDGSTLKRSKGTPNLSEFVLRYFERRKIMTMGQNHEQKILPKIIVITKGIKAPSKYLIGNLTEVISSAIKPMGSEIGIPITVYAHRDPLFAVAALTGSSHKVYKASKTI
jgi:hypothetical protein